MRGSPTGGSAKILRLPCGLRTRLLVVDVAARDHDGSLADVVERRGQPVERAGGRLALAAGVVAQVVRDRAQPAVRVGDVGFPCHTHVIAESDQKLNSARHSARDATCARTTLSARTARARARRAAPAAARTPAVRAAARPVAPGWRPC